MDWRPSERMPRTPEEGAELLRNIREKDLMVEFIKGPSGDRPAVLIEVRIGEGADEAIILLNGVEVAAINEEGLRRLSLDEEEVEALWPIPTKQSTYGWPTIAFPEVDDPLLRGGFITPNLVKKVAAPITREEEE